MTRREFVAVFAVAAFAAPKLKVVVVGGHPDDPETGCGGTMVRYAQAGHDVVSLYLTRGEAGIEGKSHDESARIRTKEAEAACRVIGARPVFAGQIDGAAVVDNDHYESFRKLLLGESPDIVFAQWPVDTHRDHRAGSLLTYDAWLDGGRRFALYYYEVMTGVQTQDFTPTDYVDITPIEPKKRQACYAHRSQGPDEMYAFHTRMHRARGLECGVDYAEAFSRHLLSRPAWLPGQTA